MDFNLAERMVYLIKVYMEMYNRLPNLDALLKIALTLCDTTYDATALINALESHGLLSERPKGFKLTRLAYQLLSDDAEGLTEALSRNGLS